MTTRNHRPKLGPRLRIRLTVDAPEQATETPSSHTEENHFIRTHTSHRDRTAPSARRGRPALPHLNEDGLRAYLATRLGLSSLDAWRHPVNTDELCAPSEILNALRVACGQTLLLLGANSGHTKARMQQIFGAHTTADIDRAMDLLQPHIRTAKKERELDPATLKPRLFPYITPAQATGLMESLRKKARESGVNLSKMAGYSFMQQLLYRIPSEGRWMDPRTYKRLSHILQWHGLSLSTPEQSAAVAR